MLENNMRYKNNADICQKVTNWATDQVLVALNIPVWPRLMKERITVS